MNHQRSVPAIDTFRRERAERVGAYRNSELSKCGHDFLVQSTADYYSYNFDWLSRPVIQYPQGIVAMQEIIWEVRLDLIIETGIAHGGSLIFSASMLTLIECCNAAERGEVVDPSKPRGSVIAVDIDIRTHNKQAIEAHPLANRIEMLQVSSVDPEIVEVIAVKARQSERVLVC